MKFHFRIRIRFLSLGTDLSLFSSHVHKIQINRTTCTDCASKNHNNEIKEKKRKYDKPIKEPSSKILKRISYLRQRAQTVFTIEVLGYILNFHHFESLGHDIFIWCITLLSGISKWKNKWNIGPHGPELIWHLGQINLTHEYNQHKFVVVSQIMMLFTLLWQVFMALYSLFIS